MRMQGMQPYDSIWPRKTYAQNLGLSSLWMQELYKAQAKSIKIPQLC